MKKKASENSQEDIKKSHKFAFNQICSLSYSLSLSGFYVFAKKAEK